MNAQPERPSAPPPPVRTRKPWLMVAAGVVGAAILILVVANIERGPRQEDKPSRISGAVDLAAPESLTGAEQAAATTGIAPDASVKLESGAWVEVADPATGRLAQRYNAARVEPLPDQWVRMDQPRASLHPKSGRIITMRSDTAVARVPRRAIESGTLEGHVVIRLFRPIDGRPPNVELDEPALEVFAEQAQFDSTSGQVRCDETVEIVTPALRYKGRGLTMTLDDSGEAPEQVVVDEAVEPIRIDLAKLAEDRAAGPAEPAKPASSGAPVGGGAGTPAPPATLRASRGFYRLTLHDDVVVTRSQGGLLSTLRGDALSLVFSLESDRLGEAVSLGNWLAPLALGPVMPATVVPWPQQVAALPFGSIQSPAGGRSSAAGETDVIEITYTGRMVMLPVEVGQASPSSPDDVWLEVVGAPVTFEDPASRTVGQCASVAYETLPQTLRLSGSSDAPFVVNSARFGFRGERLWLARRTGVGRIDGRGTMTVNEAPSALLDPLGRLDLALASADRDGAVRLVATILARTAGAGASGDDPKQSLEITWQEGVDLDFEPSAGAAPDQGGALRGAKFQGDVRVAGDDFALRSNALSVEFDPTRAAAGGDQSSQIKLIEATGGVKVNRMADRGSLSSETLRVEMDQHEGKAVPTRMVAAGSVEARDPGQSVWAGRLSVGFQPRSANAPADAPRTAGEPDLGNVEVKEVDAEDDVRVLLKDGTRVFADRLGGDAIARTLRIAGSDVMIVNGRFVADRMNDLRIDDRQGQARSEGPGRFLYFNEPVAMPREGRVDRPVVATTAPLRGEWSRSMAFDDRANDGAGSLDLRGAVALKAEPDATRIDMLNGEAVTFDLRRVGAGASGLRLPSASSDEDQRVDRAIGKVIAKGGAAAESQTWPDASHTGEPVLFKVSGEHLEYDTVSREALVVGNGELLVHDVSTDSRSAAAAAARSAFGAKGTSLFGWKKKMEMRREIDDRYVITMTDEVEILHKGLKPEDRLTLTADTVMATVLRLDPGAATAEGASDGAPLAGGGIELGGPAKLLRVRAEGRVFVRTREQDIECSEFDYNVDTGLATLRGRAGRKVLVQINESGSPIQAETVTWDLRTGTIQITGAAGAVGTR
ncbi:MAG: hypothetical protein KDA22_03125 [Phycisphaerales bacterium]|nr:hypothetical protein [Phycisphaerales bacterium]